MSIGTINIVFFTTSIHSKLKLGQNIKKKKNRLGVRRLNFRRSKVLQNDQEIKTWVFSRDQKLRFSGNQKFFRNLSLFLMRSKL
jgi:hypothetical protein